MNYVRISFCLWLVLALLLSVAAHFHKKYRYFDEYLLHVEKTILVQEIEIKPAPSLIRTGAVRSKEEECCHLGQMAGERGYLCYSQFYAARVLYRNYNRAHNKKITNLLKGRHDPAADKLMRTFSQCVVKRGAIFHKCCRYAAMKGNV